jgi:uncharacterized membrane protein
MAFSFDYPLLLALIPVLGAFIIYTSRCLQRLGTWRRRTITTLRAVVFVLIVLCLAGFGMKKTSDSITTVFVVDGSDSNIKSESVMEGFIKEAVKSKKYSDKVAVVNFGANSQVEFTPTREPIFTALQTKINGRFTNIEQALQYAASLIPSSDRKRIVLVSDGQQNAGDALKGAKTLKEQGISLDIFPIVNEKQDEVQIKDIKVPETLRMNEKFEVSVKIESSVKTRAKLKLYRDRELTSQEEVEIQKGENNFVFSDTAQKGGVVTYSAEIEPYADSLSQNNRMSAFSYIEDTARILIIQDEDEGAAEIARIMEGEVIVTVSRPDSLPIVIEEIQKYDGFIISNVSAERFDDRFLDNLDICIKHLGKGLLVTGGGESYAPGGYYKTVLEKVLPVNMDIKSKEEDPNLGLLLVIDKSSSMSSGQYGISKVELAKEAAIRATEVLEKDDMIGVIAFDGALKWVVKTQKLDNLKAVQDAIGTIRASGGTSILGPLQEAYKSLKDTDTKLKHIILLTDGQAESSGYEPLINDINSEGITLSTVAVGNGADTRLLKYLADRGQGRFYLTDEFTDIPKIFAKETFLAGKKYLNDRTFTPKLNSYSPILNDIKAIPQLDGYVSTTPKGTARLIFTSDEDEPVLATWQYGLGRTAAWTSDAKGMWTSKWMAWDQSPTFWKNLMSWLLQKKVKDDYSISGGISSGKGTVELKLPPEEAIAGEKVEAVIVDPSGKEQITSLEPISPGVYRGSFSSDETGVYIANISINDNGETIRTISSGIVIPYSPEYNVTDNDAVAFFERLAYESGGRIIKNSGEIFTGKLPPTVSISDMTNLLLILIIILLMFDIALRRLSIPFGKVEALFTRVGEKGAEFNKSVIKPALSKLKHEKKMQDGKKERKVAEANERKISESKATKQEAKAESFNIEGEDSNISKILEKKRKRER